MMIHTETHPAAATEHARAPRRALPAGLFAGLIAGLILFLATAPCAALEKQRLTLRTGGVVEARVFDTGRQSLEALLRSGRRTIPKNAVLRWVFLGDQEAEPRTLLLLTSGHEIEGDVEFSGETGEWVVRLEHGQARYPDAQVVCMVQPSGVASNGHFTVRPGFHRRVDDCIERLHRGSSSERDRAAEYLARAGFFALPQLTEALERRSAAADLPVDDLLRRLVLSQRLLVAVPPRIEEVVPDFIVGLREGTPEARIERLREAFLERGEELFELCAVLVQDEAQPAAVRAFCVELLQRVGQIGRLVQAFGQTSGRTQLALAIALGDVGIYIGVPTLIEALEIDDPEIREVAIAKLEEYTGERFGLTVGADEDTRRTAIARWQGWWRSHQEAMEEVLVARLSPEEGSAARYRAIALGQRGNAAWAEGDIDLAHDYYRSAVDEDPTYLQPLVSLGALSYLHRGDFAGAEQWLLRAARLPPQEGEESLQRLVYYHLGRLHLNRLEFQQARKAFRRALGLAPDYIDAWFDLGRTVYQEGIYDREFSAEERRDRFAEAATIFEDGIEALRRYREGLVVMSHDNLPVGSDLPFSAREHNRGLGEFKHELRRVEGRFAHELGRCQLALGKAAEALPWAQQAVEAPQPSAQDHLLLATILDQLGRSDEAAAERERAARLEEEGGTDRTGNGTAGGDAGGTGQ